MGRKVVLDIVFHAQSLNYDQGGSNYQELKKVSTWDGFNHVLTSRYALRYSILENLNERGWKLADKDILQRQGTEKKGVIQLRREVLEDERVKQFPEFFFFGFLITSGKKDNENIDEGDTNDEPKDDAEDKDKNVKKPTIDKNVKKPTIQKTSPVKISHAISMNPYRNSPLFYANLGVTKRAGYPGSNPVTTEEHLDFFVYNIVLDIDNMKKIEYIGKRDYTDDEAKKVFDEIISKKTKNKKRDGKEEQKQDFSDEEKKTIETNLKTKFGDLTSAFNSLRKEDNSDGLDITKQQLTKLKKGAVDNAPEDLIGIDFPDGDGVDFKTRLKQLLTTIFSLKRNIKGRCEDLSPWIAVVGLYDDKTPFDIYKDRIRLEKKRTYAVRREDINSTNDTEKDPEKRLKAGQTIIRESVDEGMQPGFSIDDSNKSADVVLTIYNRNDVAVTVKTQTTNNQKDAEKTQTTNNQKDAVKTQTTQNQKELIEKIVKWVTESEKTNPEQAK